MANRQIQAPVTKISTAERSLAEALRLHQAGDLDGALDLYRSVLMEDPEHPQVLGLVGLVALGRGAFGPAERFLRRALKHAPRAAGLRAHLGAALLGQGRVDEARTLFEQALDENPAQPDAAAALGRLCLETHQVRRAVDLLQRGRAGAPHRVDVCLDLGAALRLAGRTEEAVETFRAAVEMAPDHKEGTQHLGLLLLELGRRAEAVAVFDEAQRVRRASPENGGPPRRGPWNDRSMGMATPAKLAFDIEQLTWLRTREVPVEKDHLQALQSVLAGLPLSSRLSPLNPSQLDRIGARHCRTWHRVEAPEVPGPAISPQLDEAAAAAAYREREHGLVVVDDLLTPSALAGLQRFCRESTIWNDQRYLHGYMGAMLADGFASPLLLQVADELRRRLPGVIGQHALRQAWAYCYPHSQNRGIGVHADSAAVNVNFWITPDESNLDPERGGLVVYRHPSPLDWSFDEYNRDQEKMRGWLARHGDDIERVPYRCNRAVIFHSNLFHETDTLRFREGFENRRINITLLYGDRED